jgi:uncharacterized membrane protein YfcA
VLALLPTTVVGVVVGVMMLRAVDPVYVRLGVGVVVVLSTLLLLREIRLPGAGTWWRPVVAGTISGALSTSTGLAGPPIVLLFASRGLPKHPCRGSSALYFLVMVFVGFAALVLWVSWMIAMSHSPSPSYPPRSWASSSVRRCLAGSPKRPFAMRLPASPC